MTETEKGYRFESTGREMNVFGARGFSLWEDEGQFCVLAGYDNAAEIVGGDDSNGAWDIYTKEERMELATEMIAQWHRFANSSNFPLSEP